MTMIILVLSNKLKLYLYFIILLCMFSLGNRGRRKLAKFRYFFF